MKLSICRHDKMRTLDPGCPVGLSAMMEICFICAVQMGVTSHMQLLKPLKCETEELHFKFHLINLNLNSHMWLVGTVVGSTGDDFSWETLSPTLLFHR